MGNMRTEAHSAFFSSLFLCQKAGRKRMNQKIKYAALGIALACTGLATIGIAKDLEKETGLPVIDPVMAEGLFAYFEYLRKK